MSDLRINNITDRTGGNGPVIAGVSTVSSTGAFTVPSGPTEYRGERGRGIMFGGYAYSPGAYVNNIDYITIATTGNATDFGDASATNGFGSGMGSSTRGVFKLGRGPGYSDQLDYVTISSGGGSSDFGTDRGVAQDSSASFSNTTRGCFANGTGYDRKIQYITIATTGDTTEFGEMSYGAYMGGGAGAASFTRGFFFGGRESPAPYRKSIEVVNIQTRGNTTQFGELTVARRSIAACASTTRAVMGSGSDGSGGVNVIDYITMATEGNALDFGDMTQQPDGYGAGTSNQIRGVFCGSDDTSPNANSNVIDYVTITTTGNSIDFGDTTYGSYLCAMTSDAHGGLG